MIEIVGIYRILESVMGSYSFKILGWILGNEVGLPLLEGVVLHVCEAIDVGGLELGHARICGQICSFVMIY